jgi:hypothetical protein
MRYTRVGRLVGLFVAAGGLAAPFASKAQLSNHPPSQVNGVVYRCVQQNGSVEYTNVEHAGCAAIFSFTVNWKKIAAGGVDGGAWEVYATPRENEMTGATYSIVREHVTAGCVSRFVLVDQRMLYRDKQSGQPITSEKVLNKMEATANTPAGAIMQAFCPPI